MYRILLSLFATILFASSSISQVVDSVFFINGQSCKCIFREEQKPMIFEKPHQLPSYPPGEKAWNKFVKDSLREFNSEKEELLVWFVVNPDGSLSDIRKKSGVRDEKFQAAKELLLRSGKWCPGMHNGRCVRSYHTIAFRL